MLDFYPVIILTQFGKKIHFFSNLVIIEKLTRIHWHVINNNNNNKNNKNKNKKQKR